MSGSSGSEHPWPSPAELLARRTAYLDGFLAARELSFDQIKDACGPLIPGDDDALLASSPVQGLGNETSDIDILILVDDEESLSKVPFRVFDDRANVFEVLMLLRPKLEEAMEHLREVSALPPAEIIAETERWAEIYPGVKRYMLERAVNGVSLSRKMPYAGYYRDLAAVWKAQSYHFYLQCHLYALLAARAGELRAAPAYLVNAMTFLMDAVLSATGDVYTGRKWSRVRWERLKEGGTPGAGGLDTLIAAIDGCLAAAIAAVPEPAHLDACLGRAAAVLEAAEPWLGLELAATARLQQVGEVERYRLSADGWVLAGDGGSILARLPGGELPGPLALGDAGRLDPAAAAALLRLSRAEIYGLRVGGGPEDPR